MCDQSAASFDHLKRVYPFSLLKSESMVDFLFDFIIFYFVPSPLERILFQRFNCHCFFLVPNSFIHNKSFVRSNIAKNFRNVLLHISNTCCILCLRKNFLSRAIQLFDKKKKLRQLHSVATNNFPLDNMTQKIKVKTKTFEHL